MWKKKLIIISIYLISIFIFSIIAELNTERFVQWYMESMDYGNVLIAMGPTIMAEMLHILITVVLAIVIRFIKNIDIEIKRLFYKLPIITIFIWIPIGIIVSRIF